MDAERFALVWIDAEGAEIRRWRGRVVVTKVPSEIPMHERATAHVRHDPTVRRGGGGRGGDEVARHRTEHIRQFLARVEAALAADGELEVIGTGELGQRLARQVRRHDGVHRRVRPITVDHAMRPTPRQLSARLREHVGVTPVRGGVGAYRWTGDLPHGRSGHVGGPRRVVPKPASRQTSSPE